jgi:hypothetical protein
MENGMISTEQMVNELLENHHDDVSALLADLTSALVVIKVILQVEPAAKAVQSIYGIVQEAFPISDEDAFDFVRQVGIKSGLGDLPV